MVNTRKFSQFPPGTLDEAAGLAGGANTRGPTGGSSGGAVTKQIFQPNHGLLKGHWIGIQPNTGDYVIAQANAIANAETIGVVIERIDADNFIVQQAGYIETSQGVVAGLTPGSVQFLSATVAGAMSPTDVIVNGQVSRPVFYPDSATSGWVLPYRGLVVGGAQVSGGGGTVTIPDIVTVVQNNHNLNVGEWVRPTTPVGGQATYTLAVANSLANSQCCGVVIQVIDVNTFILQFSGYNIGAVVFDSTGNFLTPGLAYYLSADVLTPGTITSINPTGMGQISKPCYISERTTATAGVNAGFIVPQRPLDLSGFSNNVHTVTQNQNFQVGEWVYIQADNTYARAIATSLTSSQVAGVVTAATPTQFTVQNSGWISGAVTQDQALNPLVSGVVYYLSSTIAGQLQNVPPTAAGTFTKPLYIQESLGTFTGLILEQRPLSATSGGGTGQGAIIQSITTTNNVRQNINFTAGTWTDVAPITATITPTANTSKIKISCVIYGSPVGFSRPTLFRLVRNGVPIVGAIGSNPSGSNRLGATAGLVVTDNLNIFPNAATFLYVDSPATTIALTYTVQVVATGVGIQIFTLNGDGSSDSDAFMSSICVEEVQ
jgi:hypothetical protein